MILIVGVCAWLEGERPKQILSVGMPVKLVGALRCRASTHAAPLQTTYSAVHSDRSSPNCLIFTKRPCSQQLSRQMPSNEKPHFNSTRSEAILPSVQSA